MDDRNLYIMVWVLIIFAVVYFGAHVVAAAFRG